MTLKGCVGPSLCYYMDRMGSGVDCCYGSLCNGDKDQHWYDHHYEYSHHNYDHGDDDHGMDDCDDIFCNSVSSVGLSVLLLLSSLLSALLLL